MLRDSVIVRTRPQALAMKTIRKILRHVFPFLSHDDYGAPLGGPLGRWSSAIIYFKNVPVTTKILKNY